MPYFNDRPAVANDIMVQHRAIGNYNGNEDKNLRYGVVVTVENDSIVVRLSNDTHQTWQIGNGCYNLTARIEAMDNKLTKMQTKEARFLNKLNVPVNVTQEVNNS